ncbi:MAG: hypothetical protein LBV30_09330, partial [Propionibacteriaceae bacterium]|nr:hypothetical protein [Propionibacteriaceae bacterium]
MTITCVDALRQSLPNPGQVSDDDFERLAAAHDASHFLLYPSQVASPSSAAEVASLLKAAAAVGTSLTFRSGGT